MIKQESLPAQVYDKLKLALDLRRFTVESIYRGNAFRVSGRGNDTNIYIRIEYREGHKCVNFSTIYIDERFRRRGFLTSIVNHVASANDVDTIIIGGVCTEEMRNWCAKYDFKLMSTYGYDYYKEV